MDKIKIEINEHLGEKDFNLNIINQLDSADGADLDIYVCDQQKHIFGGLEIFNAIKKYKEENNKSKIVLHVEPSALSASLWISFLGVSDKINIKNNG